MIVHDWPPNIAKIRKVLPVTESNIFAYGGIIYVPGGGQLSLALLEHEKVHFEQQKNFKKPWWSRNRVESWWNRFLASPEFRLDQELEAHRVEHRVFCEHTKDRNLQSRHLSLLAKRLSAPMYGGLISVSQAAIEIHQ